MVFIKLTTEPGKCRPNNNSTPTSPVSNRPSLDNNNFFLDKNTSPIQTLKWTHKQPHRLTPLNSPSSSSQTHLLLKMNESSQSYSWSLICVYASSFFPIYFHRFVTIGDLGHEPQRFVTNAPCSGTNDSDLKTVSVPRSL